MSSATPESPGGSTRPSRRDVAAWAGHSVEVQVRTYVRCVTGMEDVWIARMDKMLHQEEDQ